jgi:hypothetical protein
MKQTQYERLSKLLTRKKGATAMDIVEAVGTVCPHKRLSEMKERGWLVWREKVPGKSYGVYRGMRNDFSF